VVGLDRQEAYSKFFIKMELANASAEFQGRFKVIASKATGRCTLR
jgi:hypothetical protein